MTGPQRAIRWRHLAGLAVLIAAPTMALGQAEPGTGVVHDPFPVRLVFVGDLNLGTRTLPDGLPPDSGRRLFRSVTPFLTGDLVVGNFEGVLSDSGDSDKCATKAHCYAFATPTWLATRLREAGFTHLNLANNHANDYGPDWRQHTEAALRELGIVPYGPLGEVAIAPVRRGERLTLVGLVGFTTYPHAYNLLDLSQSVAIVDSVRPLVDVMVVTFHGGVEGEGATRTPAGAELLGKEARGNLRKWAHAMIDAGADAVVGHGPHVLRGVEFYRDKPIFYSLGNFATYRGFSLVGPMALTTALELNLDGSGHYLSARIPALRQRWRTGPIPDTTGAAIRLVQELTRLDFPESGARIADDGSVVPPSSAAHSVLGVREDIPEHRSGVAAGTGPR